MVDVIVEKSSHKTDLVLLLLAISHSAIVVSYEKSEVLELNISHPKANYALSWTTFSYSDTEKFADRRNPSFADMELRHEVVKELSHREHVTSVTNKALAGKSRSPTATD